MAVPQSKVSKAKVRTRRAANSYKGLQANACPACGSPSPSHCVCKNCGTYKGKQVLTVES